MDILFDARMLNHPMSGLERVQLNVLRELCQLPDVKRVRVVLQRHEPGQAAARGVERRGGLDDRRHRQILTDSGNSPTSTT
jgi:hypothetical protein